MVFHILSHPDKLSKSFSLFRDGCGHGKPRLQPVSEPGPVHDVRGCRPGLGLMGLVVRPGYCRCWGRGRRRRLPAARRGEHPQQSPATHSKRPHCVYRLLLHQGVSYFQGIRCVVWCISCVAILMLDVFNRSIYSGGFWLYLAVQSFSSYFYCETTPPLLPPLHLEFPSKNSRIPRTSKKSFCLHVWYSGGTLTTKWSRGHVNV